MVIAIWTAFCMYLLGVITLNAIIGGAENKDELDMEPIFVALQWPLIGVRIIFAMITGRGLDEDE
jgi:hypothetical protein